jgi:hypothetical protein
MNLKTAIKPWRRGEHQVKQCKTKQLDFTLWVKRPAVKTPCGAKLLAVLRISTAGFRINKHLFGRWQSAEKQLTVGSPQSAVRHKKSHLQTASCQLEVRVDVLGKVY